MQLRASYNADTKRSALAHELGHRLIAQLTRRPSDLDEHRVLFLVLYEMWVSQWGDEFALRQVQFEGNLRGVYDYESAWRWALSLTSEQRRILEEFARVSGDANEPTSKSFFEKAKKFF